MAASQIRISLLQALRNAISCGEYEANIKDIRQECTDRKCYDPKNFTANFRNNKKLFDFDSFTRETKTVRLSEAGRKELAQVIQELK